MAVDLRTKAKDERVQRRTKRKKSRRHKFPKSQRDLLRKESDSLQALCKRIKRLIKLDRRRMELQLQLISFSWHSLKRTLYQKLRKRQK